MTTFTATRAEFDFRVSGPGVGGSAKMAYGTIAVAVNPVAADIYEICKLPQGATVTGGYVMAGDMDVNATETLELDLGWLANGDEILDADGLGDFGVWSGDATGTKPEVGSYFAVGGVLLTDGPKTFNAATTIAVTCVVTAATFAAHNLTVVIFYDVN